MTAAFNVNIMDSRFQIHFIYSINVKESAAATERELCASYSNSDICIRLYGRAYSSPNGARAAFGLTGNRAVTTVRIPSVEYGIQTLIVVDIKECKQYDSLLLILVTYVKNGTIYIQNNITSVNTYYVIHIFRYYHYFSTGGNRRHLQIGHILMILNFLWLSCISNYTYIQP